MISQYIVIKEQNRRAVNQQVQQMHRQKSSVLNFKKHQQESDSSSFKSDMFESDYSEEDKKRMKEEEIRRLKKRQRGNTLRKTKTNRKQDEQNFNSKITLQRKKNSESDEEDRGVKTEKNDKQRQQDTFEQSQPQAGISLKRFQHTRKIMEEEDIKDPQSPTLKVNAQRLRGKLNNSIESLGSPPMIKLGTQLGQKKTNLQGSPPPFKPRKSDSNSGQSMSIPSKGGATANFGFGMANLTRKVSSLFGKMFTSNKINPIEFSDNQEQQQTSVNLATDQKLINNEMKEDSFNLSKKGTQLGRKFTTKKFSQEEDIDQNELKVKAKPPLKSIFKKQGSVPKKLMITVNDESTDNIPFPPGSTKPLKESVDFRQYVEDSNAQQEQDNGGIFQHSQEHDQNSQVITGGFDSTTLDNKGKQNPNFLTVGGPNQNKQLGNSDIIEIQNQCEEEESPIPKGQRKSYVVFKIGDLCFTNEDIDYLNRVYAESKSSKSAVVISEARDKVEASAFQKCRKKCYKGMMGLLGIELSEVESEDADIDDDDDWTEIQEVRYSSGESDLETSEQFKQMPDDQKQQRIIQLWRKAKVKAVGGAKIIKRFSELNDNITMFGASRRIAVEIEEEIVPAPYILLPENRIRMAWNIVTIFLLLYTATFVPYRTSFIDQTPPTLEIWEWMVDALFSIDIIINFISAYENNDKNIEVRLKMIAKTYVTSWFLFDALAIFPFQLLETQNESDLIAAENSIFDEPGANYTYFNNDTTGVPIQQHRQSNSNQNINKLIRLARLPRLYRLLRILRLFKILSLLNNNASFKRLQDYINMNAGVQRMLMIILAVFFMVHLVACLYFLVGKFEDEDQNNWIVYRGIYDEIDSYQYIVSVYWALQTLTTVGYGDVPSRSANEKIAALIWMIIGVGFYSFTIGNLASIFNSIDVKAALLQQKYQILAEFSRRTKLSEDIQNRVKIFLENNHGDHLALFDQKELLSEIPASMRAEVVSHTHAEIINRIRFFSDKDPPFLFVILPLLKPMKVYPKDTLYCQGDFAEELFFILQGRVKMYFDINCTHQGGEPKLIPFNLYVEGSYFGDSDIFQSEDRNPRDCYAISYVESQLLVITRKELFGMLHQWPDIRQEMKEVAHERKKHHMKAIEMAVQHYTFNQAMAQFNENQDIVEENEEDASNFLVQTFKKGMQNLSSIHQKLRRSTAVKPVEQNTMQESEMKKQIKLRQKLNVVKKDQKEEILNLFRNFKTDHGVTSNGAMSATPMSMKSRDDWQKTFDDASRSFIGGGGIGGGVAGKTKVDQNKLETKHSNNEFDVSQIHSILHDGYQLQQQRKKVKNVISTPETKSFIRFINDTPGSTLERKVTPFEYQKEPQSFDIKAPQIINKVSSTPQPAKLPIMKTNLPHKTDPLTTTESHHLKRKSDKKSDDFEELMDIIDPPDFKAKQLEEPQQSQHRKMSIVQDQLHSRSGQHETELLISEDQERQLKQLENDQKKRLEQMDIIDQVIQEIENEEEESQESKSMQKYEKLQQELDNTLTQSTSVVPFNPQSMREAIDSYRYEDQLLFDPFNEEVFFEFQENMALIAGNSFEILKLYEMIKADYEMLTDKIAQANDCTLIMKRKTNNLETKLQSLVCILDEDVT